MAFWSIFFSDNFLASSTGVGASRFLAVLAALTTTDCFLTELAFLAFFAGTFVAATFLAISGCLP